MMYSPPTGGAAWTLSAAIDKKNTSKRRFIISGEEDYLCVLQNCASGRDVALRCPDAPSGTSLPIWVNLSARQILPRFPFPDQRKFVAADQDFGGQGTRIVIRGHHKSVRTCAHDCY